MRNKIALTLVTALVAASLCACASGGSQQKTTTETGQEQTEDVQEQAAEEKTEKTGDVQEAEAAVEENAETAVSDSETSSQRPTYTLIRHVLMEEDDLTLIAGGSYETIQLTEEAAIEYPSLNKFIEAENEKITLLYEGAFEEVKAASYAATEVMDEDKEIIPAGEMEAEIEAIRCDESALSLLETSYINYPGAAHGMTGYRGYNFDTATGEPITLENVIADKSALLPALSENLRIMADGSEVTDMEEELKFALEENYDNLAWVLDRDGVTFYFAPSEVAPYAYGTLLAKIPFAGYPDLFTDAYGPATGSYVRQLAPYSVLLVDLDGDGQDEAISVYGEYGADGDLENYTGIQVSVDDKSCATEESCFYVNSRFVHTEDGRDYIYAVTTSEGDYHRLTVFEIKDKMPSLVGPMEDTGYASAHLEIDGEGLSQVIPILDPASFALYSGAEEVNHNYKVGDDGMPVLLTAQ